MQAVEETGLITFSLVLQQLHLYKIGENSDATKIKHVYDIEKALNMENIDSYLGINV